MTPIHSGMSPNPIPTGSSLVGDIPFLPTNTIRPAHFRGRSRVADRARQTEAEF